MSRSVSPPRLVPSSRPATTATIRTPDKENAVIVSRENVNMRDDDPDFAALCDGPRSQRDYLELARRFSVVFLSGVPRMTDRKSVV